ncbi:hypothetical protein ACFW1A_10200 [Kitasatospora sp. NPDC058965]|uniref:hypothetical protein n=1 Tax=Kitasatospora sp. NPDC058965 TaxID=3346682 RepID=UPI003675BFE3
MSATGLSTGMPHPRTAAYLRCFPYDEFQMRLHRDAVEEHARDLYLPAPRVFLDNGCLASQALPELQRLLAAVATGQFGVVILPGRFVLSLDDAAALSIVRWIGGLGCRVIEVPSRRTG